MDQLLRISKTEQAQLFQEAAARSTSIKSPLIIEKDFWVCWTLNQIFNTPEINSFITFKGGTSLSKCYNFIDRFSEDCDLTINKEFLGINEDIKTVSTKRRKQRDKFIKALVSAAERKINEYIKPLLLTNFKNQLSEYYNNSEWQIETDPYDKQSLLFHYPAALQINKNSYVQSVIKLEFGARADNTPNESKNISPYISSILPELFQNKLMIFIPTLTAKRTFWEKITLLHAEYHRESDKLPQRIFRHYYDVVMLNKNGITTEALNDLELLDTVLMNKKTYFSSRTANYETAKTGTIKLVPNESSVHMLRQDYDKMLDMFFGEAPKFDDIMLEIKNIESTINSYW